MSIKATKSKTTKYCKEPKQKQAKRAQVIEITLYQERVKTAIKLNDQYIVN